MVFAKDGTTSYKRTRQIITLYKDKHFVHERKDSNSIQYSMVYSHVHFCAVNGKQHFDFPTEGKGKIEMKNMRVIKQTSPFFDCPYIVQM